MTDKNITFGSRLKAVRKALNLSQVELSNKTGIKQSYYSAMESGKKGLSSNTIQLLSLHFSVSPLWLLNGEGDMFISKKSPLNNELSNISIGDSAHHQNSHLVSPYDINEDKSIEARTIDDDPIFPENEIKYKPDLERFYHANTLVSHSLFVMSLLKANKMEHINNRLFELVDMCDFISYYMKYYVLNNRPKLKEAYEKYFLKQITFEELLDTVKPLLFDEKELYNNLSPYIDAINKVYDIVMSFDNEKDGALRVFEEKEKSPEDFVI